MRDGLQRRITALGRPIAGAVLGAAIGGALLQGALAVDLNGPVVVLTLAAIAIFILISDGLDTGSAPAHPIRFGTANGITLARGVLIALLAGMIGAPLAGHDAWLAGGLAATCLVLDGLDGWAARRWRTASVFGARFDMESDALLILVLCLILMAAGKAPAWVLSIGLMRYGFVALGLLLPAMRAPLPASFRRKAVCVLQGLVLALCLIPPVSPDRAAFVLGLALASLAASFAIDTISLLRRPSSAAPSPLGPQERAP